MWLPINLSAHASSLKWKEEEGQKRIYDPTRKKYLVSTPEETVRQLLVIELKQNNYPLGRIRCEWGLRIGGRIQRADLIVLDSAGNPFLLAECKRPEVPLSQNTIQQTAKYATQFNAPYVLITNGLQTIALQKTEQGFTPLVALPAMI